MNKTVVLGGGESGVGAAILAYKLGHQVILSDKGAIEHKYKKILSHYGIPYEEKQHTEVFLMDADIIIKSPGIPDDIALIQKIKAQGISIVSEIEFAFKHSKGEVIAITGSNGKTTTTALTYHIIKNAIKNIGLGGNIGNSYAKMVANDDKPLYILEVSSFQLDGIVDFVPYIAIITNITPDHLERYEYNFQKYINSKLRILENQTNSDYLVYDADDKVINNHLKTIDIKPLLVPFSLEKILDYGIYFKDNQLIVNMKEKYTIPLKDTSLQGEHNYKNAMASVAVAELLHLRKKVIKASLRSFQGVEHRLEKVAKIDNIEYINDSKATNINAVFYALKSVKRPVVWIVGGVDKGNDYSELMALVREKVKAIVCLGIDNQKIIDFYKDVVPYIVETKSMEEAVNTSYNVSEDGDCVLLSPACASFDLFENYEDRGSQFKKCVDKLL